MKYPNENALPNAIRFAEELGFRVFPCIPGGKKPLTRNGFTDATNDLNQINAWASKFPDANWAVATGSASGVFVADIDSPEAEQWFESRWIPEGAVIDTPRGGRHIYYRYDGDGIDLGITNGSIHDCFDTRGNGGYVLLPGSYTSKEVDEKYGEGAYVGDLEGLIDVPQALIDLIPEKQKYTKPTAEELAIIREQVKPENVSPQEERVLTGLLNLLRDLPNPWHPGAGWHSTGFFVACSFWRIINSPDYATTEGTAHELYMANVPTLASDPSEIWETRWRSAKKQVGDEIAEHPGDVPVALDAATTLDAIITRSPENRSTLESGFWDSKNIGDTKRLITNLRMAGASEQEAYSVSRECKAMKEMRRKGTERSTWGWVKSEYEKPADAPERPVNAPHVIDSENKSFLTTAERDIIRNHPNFIDDYISVAKEMFAEPNLPLHYVNSWIALSCCVGDLGTVFIKGERRPLGLWGFYTADSAAGKGDAKRTFKQVVMGVKAWGDVYVGQDASAEQMSDILFEKGFATSLFMQDEAARILTGMNALGQSYERKFVTAALDWYDGTASRAAKRGMEKDEVGTETHMVFNMWLQTTWENTTNLLTGKQISDGFIGRFIFAIGDHAKITDDSISPNFKGEYEITGEGSHPAAEGLGERLRGIRLPFTYMMPESDEVSARWVRAVKDCLDGIKGHQMEGALKGIMLRLTENSLKAAALLALSEGRSTIAMTDVLLAIKSLGYWVRDMLHVVSEISSSEYRRQIDAVVKFIAIKPRTKSEILNAPFAKNMKTSDVIEALTRAEQESIIEQRGERWGLRE